MMQTLVPLPQLELTMENVRVVAVLIQVDERVAADQPLIEVETAKAVQAVLSPKPGFVRKVFVQVNDQLREKALICVLTDTVGEAYQDAGVPESRASDIKAAPAARKLARDLGIDLSTITGAGPGGRITVEDVQKAGSSNAPDSELQAIPPARQALIAQMQRSLAEIPQFHAARRMDVRPLLAKTKGITFTTRLARCLAVALSGHPKLRTTIVNDKFRVAPVSIAIAMQTRHGLAAPALRLAQLESLEGAARALGDLRVKAEAGTLRGEDLADAPFAVSNLGMFQVDFFNAFVFHGQTAVLAIGRAIDGMSWFNLAADHRVVDGVEAARFLQTLQEEISRA
jgi:pyruvate/2-oxoglutarate dehydrogenase complex dihydrolipoamide acyltransferase (E2) component